MGIKIDALPPALRAQVEAKLRAEDKRRKASSPVNAHRIAHDESGCRQTRPDTLVHWKSLTPKELLYEFYWISKPCPLPGRFAGTEKEQSSNHYKPAFTGFLSRSSIRKENLFIGQQPPCSCLLLPKKSGHTAPKEFHLEKVINFEPELIQKP